MKNLFKLLGCLVVFLLLSASVAPLAEIYISTAQADIADTDSDGVLDGSDNCVSASNPDQANADGDLYGDVCDNCPSVANDDQLDADGDGKGDVCDNCPLTANADQADPDADGVGSACDNCPNAANADQADLDTDGVGDVCDPDVDGDGVDYASDNCPSVANPDQIDTDMDGQGDACEEGGDTDPPTGYVSDPSSYGEVSGTVTVNVTTQDYGSYVDTVCLKHNSFSETEIACKNLSERDWNSYEYAPSFTFSWDTTLATDGDHDLFAVMTDNAENTATTDLVPVVVNNYSEGSSDENPSLITTCEELQNINQHLGWHYRLENDIDCSGVSNFSAIGDFGGELDGQNYSVNNLKMSSFGDSNRGIFGSIASGAVVSGVKFNNVDIVCGSTYCGGVSNTNHGTIEKTSITGTLVCNGKCGGFASQNSGIISESFADLEITGQVGYGLGLGYAGLIAGQNYSGRIINSYARGSIVGADSGTLGGLVGINERWINYGDVINSYSTALVNGYQSGGLIGWQYQGSSQTGSYWDTETSGKPNMCGDESWGGSGCTNDNGLTTAQMQDAENFNGWDFDSIWAIDPLLNGGYPYLQNNHDITPPELVGAEAVGTDRTTIRVFFSEQLDFSALATRDFAVVNPETANEFTVNNISGEGWYTGTYFVELSLASELDTDTPTIYINPEGPLSIRDLWGNENTTNDSVIADDRIQPTVTTIGDGESAYQLPFLREQEGGSLYGTTMSFSEKLNTESRTDVENALTAGADKALTFRWNDNNGGDGSKLRLSYVGDSTVTFANDVFAGLIDLADNVTENTRLIDSAYIQPLIDAAEPGETIIIPAGIYNENVNINKQITLRGDASVEAGPGPNAPVIVGNSDYSGPTVNITTSWVTFRGFVIENDGPYYESYPAVRVATNVEHTTINNNILRSAYSGVTLAPGSANNIIEWNKIHNNYEGLFINGSTSNTFSFNEVYENNYNAIEIPGNKRAGGNYFYSNNIHNNNGRGINFGPNLDTEDGTIDVNDNTITSNNDAGIYIGNGTSGISISGNTITNNGLVTDETGIHVVSASGNSAHNNTIADDGQDVGVYNDDDEEVFDATMNWWGFATGPYNESSNPNGEGNEVTDNVSFSPWYGDENKSSLRGIPETGEGGTKVYTITSGFSGNLGGFTLEVPAGTTVTGPSGWNGEIDAPTLTTITNAPTRSGYTTTTGTTLEVGFPATKLILSNAAKLVFPGDAGKRVGYTRLGEAFTEITTVCGEDSQAWADANLGVEGDCKIDVAGNLVVWTKHFTQFAVFTQSQNNTGGGGGSGGGGDPCGDANTVLQLTTVESSSSTNFYRAMGLADVKGVLSRPVHHYSCANKEYTVDYPKALAVKTGDGTIFTGSLNAPTKVTANNVTMGTATVEPLAALSLSASEDNLKFSTDFIVTLPYDSTKVKTLEKLNVYHYNTATKQYDLLTSGRSLDETKKLISVRASQLGVYTVLELSNANVAVVGTPTKNGLSAAMSFADTTGHWAAAYIQRATQGRYISGYTDGTFKPNQFINRAEAAKLVALWKNSAVETSACENNLFADVNCGAWYGKFVNYLKQEKIISGFSDQTFRPSLYLTRAEAVKIILHAKGLENTDVNTVQNSFSDIQPGDWFYKLVLIAKKLDIVNGYSNGTFGPNQLITRAEFTKIFVKTLLED